MQIVVCSHAPFIPEIGTPYHLTVALGQLAQVVFVNPVLSFALRRAVHAVARQAPVQVITPAVPGAGRMMPRRWRSRLHALCIIRSVRHHLPTPLQPPVVLWAHCTEAALWLEALIAPQLFCYHRLDNFSAMDARNAVWEQRLMQRADLNFVVAPSLIAPQFMRPHSWVYLPNGVATELFARALAGTTAIPTDLAKLPRPRIGYIGAIHPDWFDIELVMKLAQVTPEWSWVMIGPKIRWTPPPDCPPNLHLLGTRPYKDLPAYLKGLDVGVIPFRCNAIAQGASPLKLYEYLAAGKAVVSAPCFHDLQQLSEFVYTADSSGEWLSAIRAALLEAHCPTQTARRVQSVKPYDWLERARFVIQTLQHALATPDRS